ncbi:hypothetical protein [Streptomyces sp. NBC_00893]|uniref:hypothetical protein n=1 Tax=Streptomyces sp. NBC_00893 TaxID=2975862 RepID=UPI00224DEAA0|nr:hypothetical protein [Streptomyces sp. NBC_00893]MCX4851095.1 hypothetical protein [Streptomyces sp. NBC_00893]
MDETIEILRREFNAEEGSFLLQLRGMQWDRAAFTRLEQAMRAVCAEFGTIEKIERWLAEGFYEMATAVPSWTSHPSFPRPAPDTYFEDCLERIGDLADWFFRGESNYCPGHAWTDL